MLYFDHNATTPVAPEVLEAYTSALRNTFGNASSSHRAGQAARQLLESSRQKLAACLHAAHTEIVFTSGGTEANNLALSGALRSSHSEQLHIVTTAIEHPAVLEPLRQLALQGAAVTHVPVGSSGAVKVEDVAEAIREETVLVSVMHANNETGTLQPLAEIGALIQARRAAGHQLLFHSDGVQAFGKVPVNIDSLGVDLYSLSAHKIHAPKGTGALFVRKGTPLQAIQFGGKHERERRAGTENVPGIAAFAFAAEWTLGQSSGALGAMRDEFEQRVLAALPNVEVNGAPGARLPNTSNLLFRDVSGESLLIALDRKGMAVSTGSACSSGSIDPSPVLLAMGRSREEARSSVRFSFGPANSPAEIEQLAEAVVDGVRRARESKSRRMQLVS